MRLLLVNPANGMVNILQLKESRWNRYRVWQPLGLMTLAGLTPRDWDVDIVDENLGIPVYAAMQRPDLVGITAFTSQAPRAYAVAAQFRKAGVPVVMGGIHATMCLDEAMGRVDAVVTGEADGFGRRCSRTRGRDGCSAATTADWHQSSKSGRPGTTCCQAVTPSARSKPPGDVP